MLGAIVGDIVGSVYEWHNIKTKEFHLFRRDCRFTDDTVMTCAVAKAIMDGGDAPDFAGEMKALGRRYPHAGYGGRFALWLAGEDSRPYHSFGNGSAMRVSPCGWVMDFGAYARTGIVPDAALARQSAAVTHDHPEGIKGAMAVADAIFLCRAAAQDGPEQGKAKLKAHIEKRYGYDLSRTLREIRPGYRFDVSCQGSLPEAIIAFLESTDFEDAIRNAVSLGGDSDTIAAIAGSIAEAAYGIPDAIKEAALSYLDGPLRKICSDWEAYLRARA